MNDTSPDIAAIIHRRIMALSGEERFLMGIRMCEAARRMVLASLPTDISETERKQRLFQRFQGNSILKYAAEQAISEEEALQKGMEEKSKEFAEKGSELYAKA